MITWKTGAGVALAGGAIALTWACLHHEPPPPPTVGGDDGGSGCGVTAGNFPPPSCDDTAEMCAASGTCDTSPCVAGSPCLAMADNKGKPTLDFRMRKLEVGAPKALGPPSPVQGGVVDNGIKLASQCGEDGTGLFSWLLRFDMTGMKLTTGGSPPPTDPFGTGYCFVDTKIGALMVAPVTVALTKNADGTYDSAPIPKLNVPIYVKGMAPVVLPISQGRLKSVAISTDGNCIGSYNPKGVQAEKFMVCADNGGCARWFTAGSLGGYITLDEADNVPISILGGSSLCTLLTNNFADTDGGKNCARDGSGKIIAKGDFCSTTDMAGGCADSFWLAAAFAASAVKINDGTGVPDCSGGPPGDGGTEGGDGGGTDGGPGDAASDVGPG